MGLIDRIAKAFSLGPAVVQPWETSFGHGQDHVGALGAVDSGKYAATNTAVYACTTLRAKNLAKLRLRLYRRAANGDRVEVTTGRLYDLLKSVNPHWTFRRLLRMTEMALATYGQAFWVLETGTNRTATQTPPREIWWANPMHMRVLPDPVRYVAGYVYEHNGARIAFAPEDVVWLRYDNPVDEYSGLSPISAARMAIDTAYGAMRSNKAIFEGGMQLSGVLGPADKRQALTREQTEMLAAMLERRFRGADKAHRLAVLTQPVAFTALNLTPKDAEFLGLMRWGMREVCTAFGVPPELIGDHEHATYSNIQQAARALWTDTLIPEATFLADEITEQLVPLFKGEADEVEFDTSEIETLQEDRGALIDQITKLVAVGVPLNRTLQELAPQFLPPGERGYAWGDAAWLPTNTLSPVTAASYAGMVAPPKPTPATPPQLPAPDMALPPAEPTPVGVPQGKALRRS